MPNRTSNLTNSDIPTLLAIGYKFGDWIISLLQLYILINSALIGWIITREPSWSIPQKIIVSIVYVTAMSTNFFLDVQNSQLVKNYSQTN